MRMKESAKRKMGTKSMVCCALLAAINIVLARFVSLMPSASTRFSIEAVPVFLAGMLFGPAAGAMVGFSADFIGCLFTPFGYNPILSVPPVLYGLFGGLSRPLLRREVSLWHLVLAYLPPVVLGSILYQSAALGAMFFDGPLWEGFLFYLPPRAIQFSVAIVLDILITFLLFKSGLFVNLGLWPCRADSTKP